MQPFVYYKNQHAHAYITKTNTAYAYITKTNTAYAYITKTNTPKRLDNYHIFKESKKAA